MPHAEPSFSVHVDEVDYSANFRSRLIYVRVTDDSGRQQTESDSCEVALSDEYGILAIPRRGAWITIALGWNGNLVHQGRYQVESVVLEGGGERPWIMTICGRAAGLGQGRDMDSGVLTP